MLGLLFSVCVCVVVAGVSDGLVMATWWVSPSAEGHQYLAPVARFLLSLPAGNGDVERYFGRLGELWSDAQRQSSLEEHCLLACHGPQLGMSGYKRLDHDVGSPFKRARLSG